MNESADWPDGWHLAEINVARLRAPLTDPSMVSFVEQLDTINRLAERTPGFVWRLTAADGSASSYVRVGDDERLIVNMSVWRSIEALHGYTYRAGHGAAFRDRRRWFEALGGPHVALWWIPAGHIPTIEEGMRRLNRLSEAGPSRDAFTFKERFPPP